MAFNNGFPATYQPFGGFGYPQYQQMGGMQQQAQQAAQQPVQAPAPNNNLIWVQGEAGAKAYLVAPNTTVQLWDSDAQVIYLKSADASGMPSIKTLDYTIREMPAAAPNQPRVEYATKADVEALRAEFNALRTAVPIEKGDGNDGKSSV